MANKRTELHTLKLHHFFLSAIFVALCAFFYSKRNKASLRRWLTEWDRDNETYGA